MLYINGCAMLLLILIYFQAVNDRCWKKPCFLMKHVVCEHSWHACFQHRLPLSVFKTYSSSHSQSISNINQRNSHVWGLQTQRNQYKTAFQCNVLHSWAVLPSSGIHVHAEIVWRNMFKQEIRNYCLWRYLTTSQSAVNKLGWKCPCTLFFGGTRWRSWLRHYATSRSVTGSILDAFIGIFHWHNPSDRTIVLGSTQTLTEMSTRNISWR